MWTHQPALEPVKVFLNVRRSFGMLASLLRLMAHPPTERARLSPCFMTWEILCTSNCRWEAVAHTICHKDGVTIKAVVASPAYFDMFRQAAEPRSSERERLNGMFVGRGALQFARLRPRVFQVEDNFMQHGWKNTAQQQTTAAAT